MIDDQVARRGIEKGARILDMRRVGGGKADEGGLRDVFRLRRSRTELRPHVAAKSFPVNEIQVGKLLPALAVHGGAGFEQMDQALGERVRHDDPGWKIVA